MNRLEMLICDEHEIVASPFERANFTQIQPFENKTVHKPDQDLKSIRNRSKMLTLLKCLPFDP